MAKSLQFFHSLENLKKTKRTGWIGRGVQNPESVSDHAFRMSVMALVLGPKLKCNTSKLVEMCLVHDLPEALCGDLVLDFSRFFKGERMPKIMKKNRVSEKEKQRREHAAMKKLFSNLDSLTRQKFEKLWNEFEEQKTRESKIARELDWLEMVFQAAEYEKARNYKKPVWPAWLEAYQNRFQTPVLKKLFNELAETMR